MSDSNDIQNIHRRYTLTLINPASFYVSLCGSIAVASIISFLCFNNYIQNYEIFYHLPAVVAVLLGIQYLDSRFTKHKEYSKSLHMSFFGNALWSLRNALEEPWSFFHRLLIVKARRLLDLAPNRKRVILRFFFIVFQPFFK